MLQAKREPETLTFPARCFPKKKPCTPGRHLVLAVNEWAGQVQVERSQREIQDRALSRRGAAIDGGENGIEQLAERTIQDLGNAVQQQIDIGCAKRRENHDFHGSTHVEWLPHIERERSRDTHALSIKNELEL